MTDSELRFEELANGFLNYLAWQHPCENGRALTCTDEGLVVRRPEDFDQMCYPCMFRLGLEAKVFPGPEGELQ